MAQFARGVCACAHFPTPGGGEEEGEGGESQTPADPKGSADLREFVNYRHPGPRRVCKVGSEPQFTTSFQLDRLDRLDPVRVPKYGFVYTKPYFSLSGRPPTSWPTDLVAY